MNHSEISHDSLAEILWEALDGGSLDVSTVKARFRPDATFEQLGLDSLDITEFLLRVQDRFKITVRQGELNRLRTVEAIAAFLAESRSAA